LKAAPIPFPNRATTFGFVLVAGAVNVSAFAFELFERVLWIDKALHAFTGFAATLAALYLLRDHLEDAIARAPRNVVLACAAFGLAIGLAWELLEWLGDTFYGLSLMKGHADTAGDLLMDALGAAAAGLAAQAAWQARRGV
jgi:hypothetical protein